MGEVGWQGDGLRQWIDTLRNLAWAWVLGLLREATTPDVVQVGAMPPSLAASAELQSVPGCLCCNAEGEGWVGRPEKRSRHALAAASRDAACPGSAAPSLGPCPRSLTTF